MINALHASDPLHYQAAAMTDLKPAHLETLWTSFQFSLIVFDSHNNILVNIAKSNN